VAKSECHGRRANTCLPMLRASEGSKKCALRSAREPASIVLFCFRWVSPHREDTDNAISLAGWGEKWTLPWSECSGARTR
jgi:hypothetical protein